MVERAVQRLTEQAANADAIADEAMEAGLDGSSPLVVNMKMMHAELLSVRATSSANSNAKSTPSCGVSGALRRRSRRPRGSRVARRVSSAPDTELAR